MPCNVLPSEWQAGSGKGYVQGVRQITVMDPLGSRRALKSLEEWTVFPEEMKELMEVRILHLLAHFDKRFQHLFSILLRLWEKSESSIPLLLFAQYG